MTTDDYDEYQRGRDKMTAHRKTPDALRSARWFAPDDLRSSGHRSRIMQMGYSPDEWMGKPLIAIINTWSDINPCHAHFKQRVEDVKRGILQAGGFPWSYRPFLCPRARSSRPPCSTATCWRSRPRS
jgi:dihydroxy-acid dehydratase